MSSFKFSILVIIIILSTFSNQLFAAECQAVFPDVIASHGSAADNSEIHFGSNARLINNPDAILSTFQISHNLDSSIKSCTGVNCTASGRASALVNANFLAGNGTIDSSPPSNEITTFGTPSVNNYDQITADADATLNFSDNHDVYFFEHLSVGFNNTLNLSAGKTYYFKQFSIASGVDINIIGTGTAIVYVDSGVMFTSATTINSNGENVSGDVSKLVMHVNGDVVFDSEVTFSGALYAEDITFTSASFLYGVASGEKFTLSANSVLTYDADVFSADFDDLCQKSISAALAIANFKFDEHVYANAAGEVKDSIGSFHGRAQVAQPVEGKVCQAVDLSATGIEDYVVIDEAILDNKSEFSVSLWTKTAKTGPQSFLSGATSDSNNELIMWFTGDTSFTPHLQNINNGTLSVSSIAGNRWRHLVWTHGNNKSCLFIDKVAQGCIDQPTSTLDIASLIVGQEHDRAGSGFDAIQAYNGLLDELIIYGQVIGQDQINQIYDYQNNGLDLDGEPILCPIKPVHHYEIVHDGNGLTCASEPITIKACTNSECASNSDLSTESVSLYFIVTSPTDGNIIKASPTFTGSTSFTFNHFVAEDLTLSISGATVTASNPIDCSADSCNMTFADAGFRFLSGDENNETIAHQTSGIEFVDTLKLQAVKSKDGVCEGLFSGNVNISLAQENVTPDLGFNAGLVFQTDNDDIAKYPQFSNDVILAFDADSTAIITKPRYLDAGKIRLHAKYASDDIALVGSSNEFWVKPERFLIDSTASYNATADSTFVAGKDFTFHVSALNENGDITQNYRQSDGELQLKVSGVTAIPTNTVNGRFTYADNSDIERNAGFQPVVLTNFSDDEKGKSVFKGGQYDEVDIINVDIQDINYGGLSGSAGLVSGNSLTMGRFIPAYFKQTVSAIGKLDAYHSEANLGECAIEGWAYTGQRTADNKGTIGYSLEPKIAITAYNAQNEITKNYTLGAADGFMRLLAKKVNVTLPGHDDEQLRVYDEELSVDENAENFVKITAFMDTGKLDFSDDEGVLVAGQMLYTFSDNDHFSYDRDDTSFLKPFLAKIPFVTEQITDEDGVTLQTDPTGTKIAEDAIKTLVSSGVEVRFARMVLANAYGSENARLRSPLSIEVYDGINFAIATDESCLTASINDKKPGAKYSGNMNTWDYRLIDIDTDNIQISDTEASVSGIFDKGIQNQLFFSSPSLQGTLEWEYEVPDWFKFKWNGVDGSADGNFYDDNPSATLSFGLYRGNDRIISWREISN